MPTHELFVNKNGTVSLRELKSGEVMHSSVGPREEATLLYVEQSRLVERLSREGDELVLWDVGLGAGTNALAALQAARAGASRKLNVVSFETDPSGFELALANAAQFPFFEGLEAAGRELLDKGSWRSGDGRLSWALHAGDFRSQLRGCPAPELVFFDFYSPKVASELWSVRTFEAVRRACPPRSDAGLPTLLLTYSASTRVRVALLIAGFFVGYGRSTGAKTDTTVASTTLSELERPLDERWLERFKRSHEPLPHGWPEERKEQLFEAVLGHPQFREK